MAAIAPEGERTWLRKGLFTNLLNLSRPTVIKTLDQLTGCLFIAFGARPALARR